MIATGAEGALASGVDNGYLQRVRTTCPPGGRGGISGALAPGMLRGQRQSPLRPPLRGASFGRLMKSAHALGSSSVSTAAAPQPEEVIRIGGPV